MMGRKIFEYELDVTGIEDTGIALPDIISKKAIIPASGVRVDVAFSGKVSGEVEGTIRGVDYIQFHADGSVILDIRAMIQTKSGHHIAISADGRALLNETGTEAAIRENIHLNTAASEYRWLNTHQIWGVGKADFARGKIYVKAYLQ